MDAELFATAVLLYKVLLKRVDREGQCPACLRCLVDSEHRSGCAYLGLQRKLHAMRREYNNA